MKKICLSLKTLFHYLTENNTEEGCVSTEYGYIQKETDEDKEWYDFKTNKGIPCMDGEVCEVLEENETYIELQEEYEKIPFKLSKKEYKIAATNAVI